MSPEEELEYVRENALIALTFLNAQHNPDQTAGAAEREMILKAYPRERLDRGLFFLLNAVLGMEAASLGIPMSERIAQLRHSMLENLQLDTE